MRISIVVPIYNERENIRPLVERVASVLKDIDYELIMVDDGSHDGSGEVLRSVSSQNGRVKIIFLQRNYGQTAALAAGIDYAQGEVLIPMDGDLENDPADIPTLLSKFGEGYDVVSGWRVDRWKNRFITRRIPSQFANWLISKVAGLRLHDYGCTLKAYRAKMLKGIQLYGDMHRVLPAYAHWGGAKICEVAVSNRARTYGKSNYGVGRVWRVLLDLVAMKFLFGYSNRPLHLFGGVGIGSIVLGFFAGALAVYYKLSVVHHKDFVETPLPVIMAMLVVVGVVLIMMGLLAEVLMRTYHEALGKTTYLVKEKVGFLDLPKR